MDDVIIGGDTITETDLIRQDGWIMISMEWWEGCITRRQDLSAVLGEDGTGTTGIISGRVIWARYPGDIEISAPLV